jgi:hypothetical protein
MGGVPKPILSIVAVGLLLAASVGFVLGFTQSSRKAVSEDTTPIAANLPANVVIKDAQPLAPPTPPPPKAKLAQADGDDSDEAPSGEAASPPPQAAAPADQAPLQPIPAPGPPSLPGQQLPADLPPT